MIENGEESNRVDCYTGWRASESIAEHWEYRRIVYFDFTHVEFGADPVELLWMCTAEEDGPNGIFLLSLCLM